mmetsp:Transcript_21044/g.71747  ORF Transcript_21044/g.71747 Transcript_21044/m.71747 type:complete len:164 (-) Transcript_21044:26-517(-)
MAARASVKPSARPCVRARPAKQVAGRRSLLLSGAAVLAAPSPALAFGEKPPPEEQQVADTKHYLATLKGLVDGSSIVPFSVVEEEGARWEATYKNPLNHRALGFAYDYTYKANLAVRLSAKKFDQMGVDYDPTKTFYNPETVSGYIDLAERRLAGEKIDNLAM